MEVSFADADLDRLETDASFTAGLPPAVVSAFRKRMQVIRAAQDERDLRAMRSWRYEKLKGNRSHQRSIRLNRQWRLVFEITDKEELKVVVIVSVEDYH